MIEVKETKLKGVLLIKPTFFEDHRGEYLELYNEKLYKSKGIDINFIEDDISIATRGVIKGIHGDSFTWKLISCLYGKFYLVVIKLSENIKSLFLGVSAAFFAIPLIYLFYQVAQNLSKKRLNKEIFDYAKMQIDREILSIINQLHKIVYPVEEREFSTTGIKFFLSIEKEDLKEILSKN